MPGASGRNRNGNGSGNESAVSGAVKAVYRFVRYAEFEILVVLFFVIGFIFLKDLASRPEYNQILLKKSGGVNPWPY